MLVSESVQRSEISTDRDQSTMIEVRKLLKSVKVLQVKSQDSID